jgi:hypothetical protein
MCPHDSSMAGEDTQPWRGADQKGKQICHIEPCRNMYKFVYQALLPFDMLRVTTLECFLVSPRSLTACSTGQETAFLFTINPFPF